MSCAALALLGLALVVAPAGASPANCFADDLAAVEAAVEAGQWKRARSLAERIDRRVIDKIAGNSDCLRPTLARLAALRAVATASSGDLETALWLWLGAEALDTEQLPDLAGFPTAADLAVERRAAPLRKDQPAGVVREVHRRRSTPPRLYSIVMGRRLSGSATVTGDLTVDGLPAAVRISSLSPRIAYAVLDFCAVAPKRPGTPRFRCKQSF